MIKIHMILPILITFVGLPFSASAEEGVCPIGKENQTLLEQDERYLNEHPVGHYSFGSDLPLLPMRMTPVSDTILRDQDFLTAPIFNSDDLLKATKQASDLASKGQPLLAKKIQERITDESNRLYGRAATSKQLSCISVAERLRKTAWKLELREDSSPPSSRVEESYRGIVEVFQHELGDSPLTANALGDLARICDAQGKTDEAQTNYERAVSIYKKNPHFVDADMCSVLEQYCDFLQRHNQQAASDEIAQLAIASRRKIYAQPHKP